MLVMGILNVTPDSFADGGLHYDTDLATARGLEMIEEGVDIIDVGGESTRPGADRVSE
jgi:dihydropteroate synthase